MKPVGSSALLQCAVAAALVTLAAGGWAAPATGPTAPAPRPARPLLQKARAGPMAQVEDIIYCTRARYDDPHWYANIAYYCDDEQKKAYAGNGQPDVGRLLKWNVRTDR